MVQSKVLRAEVPVDEAACLQKGEGLEGVAQQWDRFKGRKRDPLVEAGAGDHLHGEVGPAVCGGAEVVDLDRPRVGEALGDEELLAKRLACGCVVREGGGEHLEGDQAIGEPIEGQVNLPHPPLAQQLS
ncbi:hypothetical protein D3C86_993260 [compost metagenome]